MSKVVIDLDILENIPSFVESDYRVNNYVNEGGFGIGARLALASGLGHMEMTGDEFQEVLVNNFVMDGFRAIAIDNHLGATAANRFAIKQLLDKKSISVKSSNPLKVELYSREPEENLTDEQEDSLLMWKFMGGLF